jgi:hypothetical protein
LVIDSGGGAFLRRRIGSLFLIGTILVIA